MRHTVYKCFFAWNYDKEEKWLNEMSAKGMQLVSVGLCKYIFQEGTVGEYNYRIELLNQLPSHPESISYIHFLEDTGIEHVGTYIRWIYLRKKASEGIFNLYSDNKSQISHLKRIIALLICLLPLQISALSTNIIPAVEGSATNLILSSLLAVITVLMFIGIVRLGKKLRQLKKESTMCE